MKKLIVNRFTSRCKSLLLGFRTRKKLVVIESDDWGSLRMRSKETFDRLKMSGIPIQTDPYSLYDSLENSDDLYKIFSVFRQFADAKNNPPVITANFVLSNPDFQRIGDEGYSRYFRKNLKDTYNDYAIRGTEEALGSGIREGFFFPSSMVGST